jgi:PRTRC genetic system protein F
MNNVFTIPALVPQIPALLTESAGLRKGVLLARCLLDAGFVPGLVSSRLAQDPLAACRSFLSKWIAGHLSGLRCFMPEFRLLLDGDGAADPRARILWYAECNAVAVGAALELLEQIQPRLGATVLSVIDRTSMNLVPVFTPWDAMGTAQETYWYGEQDEQMALDEQCGDDPGERATLQEDMVTRAKVDAAFPSWATQAPGGRKRLRRSDLSRIARDARSARVRRVAELALALDRLDIDDRYLPDEEGWFVGYGAVLSWHPDDIAVRIFDDFANYAVESEYFDWIGEFTFSLDEPQALQAWMASMQACFEGIRWLDTLIHELSTGDWRKVPKGLSCTQ